MDYLDRPLAITDIETTGLDAQRHEIIEIGLIVAEQKTLKILDKFEVKIKPTHIQTAQKKGLERNGYNEKEWRKAWDLKDALEIYAEKAKNGIFVAQNAYVDWSFLAEAFKNTGVEDPTDYHRIDLFSVGWAMRNKFGLTKFSLSSMCKQLGIELEPMPHRAMNGAKKAYEILNLFVQAQGGKGSGCQRKS
jgi:DNA polymerase-3 subunit epsilon